MLFYYFSRSSAVPLAIFPPETPGISLLRNHPSHVAIWAPDPYMKACLWNIKSVHTHFSLHSETWPRRPSPAPTSSSSTGCQRAPPRPPATPARTPTRTPGTSTAGPRASPRPPATPAPTPTCTPAHRAGGPPRPLGPPAPPPHREYGFHDFGPRPYHPAPPREGYGYAGPGPHLYQPHRSVIRHSRAGSAPGSAPLGLITKESSISSQPIRSPLPQLEWSGRPQLAPGWPHARAPPRSTGRWTPPA